MISQISYVKLIRQNFRQRGWAAALVAVAAFLMMPVAMMIQIENKLQWMNEYQSGYTKQNLLHWYQRSVGPANGMMIAFAVLSALLLGVTGFSYLHSREKTDFYHSLPMNRGHLLAGNYMSGVLMFLVPYLVCYLMIIFIGWRNQLQFPHAVRWSAGTIAAALLIFLLFYTVTIFAMILTGKLLSGILLAVTFWIYGSMIKVCVKQLCESYYLTYFNGNETGIAVSPVDVCVRLMESGNKLRMMSAVWFLLMLLGIAAVTALTVALYKLRPSEASGNVLAFSRAEGIVKTVLVIPAALLAGIVVSMNAAEADKWFLIAAVSAAVILSVAMEFVYHLNLKSAFRMKYSMLSAVVTVVICFCIFKYDFTGYDAYMPKETQLRGVGIRFAYALEYFGDDNGAYSETEELRNLEVRITPEIYDNLQEIAARQKAVTEKILQQDVTGEMLWYPQISVMYHLDSGKEVFRHYRIEEKECEQFVRMMMEQKDYHDKAFSLARLTGYDVQDASVRNARGYNTELHYTSKELKELLQNYEEDLQAASFEDIMYEHVQAEITVNYAVEDEHQYRSAEYLPVYESFARTMEYLAGSGYNLKEGYDPSQIETMRIEDYRDGDGKESVDIVISAQNEGAQEKFEELFPYLQNIGFSRIWNACSWSTDGITVTIFWKDGMTSSHTLTEEGVDLL